MLLFKTPFTVAPLAGVGVNDIRELDPARVRWELSLMGPRYRQAAITLALAAMLLRAFLPMGWMPNPAGFAESPLVICLMDMPLGAAHAMDMSKSMDMDMPGMDMHGHDHGQQQNNEQCPFAAAPHAAAPITVAELAPPSILSHFVVHEAALEVVKGATRYQPQSPRAPPKIV
jgi:hypothetical protein